MGEKECLLTDDKSFKCGWKRLSRAALNRGEKNEIKLGASRKICNWIFYALNVLLRGSNMGKDERVY